MFFSSISSQPLFSFFPADLAFPSKLQAYYICMSSNLFVFFPLLITLSYFLFFQQRRTSETLYTRNQFSFYSFLSFYCHSFMISFSQLTAPSDPQTTYIFLFSLVSVFFLVVYNFSFFPRDVASISNPQTAFLYIFSSVSPLFFSVFNHFCIFLLFQLDYNPLFAQQMSLDLVTIKHLFISFICVYSLVLISLFQSRFIPIDVA